MSILKDWYPKEVAALALPLARLVCQRANCWWDANLRRKYANWLLAILIVTFVAVLAIFPCKPTYAVRTAYEMSWADMDNGDLLRAAESQFELFITTDSSVRHQQNLRDRRMAILLIPQMMAVV